MPTREWNLPLRMIAAGIGDDVELLLWVIADGPWDNDARAKPGRAHRSCTHRAGHSRPRPPPARPRVATRGAYATVRNEPASALLLPALARARRGFDRLLVLFFH